MQPTTKFDIKISSLVKKNNQFLTKPQINSAYIQTSFQINQISLRKHEIIYHQIKNPDLKSHY